MQMSGALKYYTSLPIARWDAIRPERFQDLRQAVEERGFRWYALLWPFEEEGFRKNLPGGGGDRDCQRHRSLAARLRRVLCEFVRSQSETRRRLADSPKSSWRLQDPNRQDDRLQALEL